VAVEFMLEQKGSKRRDLEPAIGSHGRVPETLNRNPPLTAADGARPGQAVADSEDILVRDDET
jgi:hypothetical protein